MGSFLDSDWKVDLASIWARIGSDFRVFFEAFASWPWFNYLASKVPAGKKALITNIDETAVCLFQGARRGAMLQHPGDNCRAAAWLMQRERNQVTKHELHMARPPGHRKSLLNEHAKNITGEPQTKDRTLMRCIA